MIHIWVAWVLLVLAQMSVSAVGTVDLPSPYGPGIPFYGERLVGVLALAVLSVYVWRSPASSAGLERVSCATLAALACALVASPEPARYAFPVVLGLAHALLAWQLTEWALAYDTRRLRTMAGVVAAMQWLGLLLYVYAQTRVEIVPAEEGAAGALHYLHGPFADLAPTILGGILLLVATLRR